jgi:hypothetical protein
LDTIFIVLGLIGIVLGGYAIYYSATYKVDISRQGNESPEESNNRIMKEQKEKINNTWIFIGVSCGLISLSIICTGFYFK